MRSSVDVRLKLTCDTTMKTVQDFFTRGLPHWRTKRGGVDRLSTFGTRAFSLAGPTLWNSLPNSLYDPPVKSGRFKAGLENASLPDIRDMSALQVSPFHGSALHKSTYTY